MKQQIEKTMETKFEELSTQIEQQNKKIEQLLEMMSAQNASATATPPPAKRAERAKNPQIVVSEILSKHSDLCFMCFIVC